MCAEVTSSSTAFQSYFTGRAYDKFTYKLPMRMWGRRVMMMMVVVVVWVCMYVCMYVCIGGIDGGLFHVVVLVIRLALESVGLGVGIFLNRKSRQFM